MNITDPIADLLTRIRNASTAKHPSVDIPASNLKKAIANILLEEGYVKGVQVIADDKQGVIRIALKYTETGAPVISGIRRVSKPGLRIYTNCEDMPKVMKGLGTAIISTSKGQGGPREQRWRRSSRLCVVRKGHRQCRELEENPSSFPRALRSRSMAATLP